MEFSRLDDTQFPNFDTTAPYAIKNTFDYTRWVPDTKVHLMNVLWNGDYSNVVKFDSDSARDSWFESISDAYVLTLTSNARMVPDGTIKLPLPYDVAARYDYLYVDIPIATSPDEMIQNENKNGIRRWFFFIGDVDYSAPNTTIMHLQLDVWTQFINQTKINHMMLRRGHAPVANSDTDTYLANPISNNRYLLAPDVNYDDSTVTRDSKFVPFGNGKKWFCFASTVGYTALWANVPGAMPEDSSWSGFTSPTFSDTSDWYGYQLQVNGYGFGSRDGYDSMNAWSDEVLAVSGNEPNGTCTYGVPGDQWGPFIRAIYSRCPAFLRTIQVAFVVDESMISIQTQGTFCGQTVYVLQANNGHVADYDLTKGMFHFDSQFQRFAKLYTYPYSRLEISDTSGKSVDVRIENTGSIGIERLVSVAFPMLDFRALITGVNGDGSNTYTWKNINDNDLSESIAWGDWQKLSFDMGIPTYSLYMKAQDAWLLDNYAGNQNSREQALAAYHNKVRSANSDYTNANASAATAQTNAVASANTAQTNANASAATTHTNANNTAQCASDNVNLQITANDANTQRAVLAANRITGFGAANALAVTNNTNEVSFNATSEENETSIATTKYSGSQAIRTSAMSGAYAGASASHGNAVNGAILGIAGAVVGGITASIDAETANSNASLVAQTNSTLTALANASNTSIRTANTTKAADTMTEENAAKTDMNTNNDTCMAGQRDNNYNTNTTNATNLHNTQTANAGRTNSTAVANAGRTYSTSTANSTRSRQVQVLNAQESLVASQDVVSAPYSDASRKAPIRLTESNGSVDWWYGRNGVQFRLRTQSDSAIAQTAAQFARYGYALNQSWDVGTSGLNLMKHFTYWQADDLWVDVRNVASAEVGDVFGSIFKNGVTVWKNPDEIGKVGIYDN